MIINGFTGIKNTVPARSISNTDCVDAVDVLFDDSGAIIQRDGYPALSEAISVLKSYQSLDGDVYFTSDGNLYRKDSLSINTLLAPSTATSFADFDRFLFTNDGLVVHANAVSNINIPTPSQTPDIIITAGDKPAGFYIVLYTYINSEGVEGGTSPPVKVVLSASSSFIVNPVELPGYTTQIYISDADGEVLFKRGTREQIKPILVNANSFPENVNLVEYWHENLYVTVPFASNTIVLFSEPNHYHLYGYNDRYFIVPGHIEAMRSVDEGIVIATNSEIYIYDGSNLLKLANYGVIPGEPIVRKQDKSLLIYTQRGVCSFPPFTELTQSKVSLPMGSQCTTAIMFKNGVRSFIALHDDSGVAFNKTT